MFCKFCKFLRTVFKHPRLDQDDISHAVHKARDASLAAVDNFASAVNGLIERHTELQEQYDQLQKQKNTRYIRIK